MDWNRKGRRVSTVFTTVFTTEEGYYGVDYSIYYRGGLVLC